jgi:hypothetical protein
MKWVAALVGAIAGYYCIAIPSCFWFWPESNLCGIWSPLGVPVGAVLAYGVAARMSRIKDV